VTDGLAAGSFAMRRILLTIVALFATVTAAAAGDYADRTIIGFSPDGRVFAFEEYGIQDGSGFPYANIYFIDTATDTWLDNTPIRVRIDPENATLDQARQQAFDQALPYLTQYQIGELGRLLVRDPITELSGDPHVTDFLIRAIVPPANDVHTLTINETIFPLNNTGCPPEFGPYQGFSLTLRLPGGETRTLHEDTRIPDSRRCPLYYGISDVVAFDRDNEVVLIVLINVFSVGFEGPDRRYVAVATTIPNQ
jgi:predicted secreted protein